MNTEPVGKLTIKKGKISIESSTGTELKDGHYVIYPERSLSLNDAWKGLVRFIANELGEGNTKAVEMFAKQTVFLNENIRTSELNDEDLREGIRKLSTWALHDLNITIPETYRSFLTQKKLLSTNKH